MQRSVGHVPADKLPVALVQGSPARLAAQLEECCRSESCLEPHCWARKNEIQANDLMDLALLC